MQGLVVVFLLCLCGALVTCYANECYEKRLLVLKKYRTDTELFSKVCPHFLVKHEPDTHRNTWGAVQYSSLSLFGGNGDAMCELKIYEATTESLSNFEAFMDFVNDATLTE